MDRSVFRIMKRIRTLIGGCLVLGILVTICWSAPEFSGVLKSAGKTYLSFRPEGGAASGWREVGESFGEYKIVSYDEANDMVVLSRAGTLLEVRLKGARVESKPTLALIEEMAKGGNQAVQKMVSLAKILDERRAKTASDVAVLESRATSDQKAAERLPELRRKLKIEEDNMAYYLHNVVKSLSGPAKP